MAQIFCITFSFFFEDINDTKFLSDTLVNKGERVRRSYSAIAYEDYFFVQFYISHNEMNSFQILGISKFFKQLNYNILDWLCQVLC
mgnify:CR=1 FL=1